MAIISRKVADVYHHRCTTCQGSWASEDEDGGEEAARHKH